MEPLFSSGIKVPECPGDDTKSDTILQRVQELQERVDRLESLAKPSIERVFKGEPHALTIRIPEELWRELEALKASTGESINSLVLKAVSRMVSTLGE
jgi:predicted HicB family RNase H-like nuclease